MHHPDTTWPRAKGHAARRGALAAMLAALSAACSPLTGFNALMPKDAGSHRLITGAAFGAAPRQKLDIYAPRRIAPGQHVPVIVFLYGGAWSSGERTGYGFVGRALAAQGFLVAIPDYRLVPQVRYPAFLQDNASAIAWLRAHVAPLGGDPDRLVLVGHSAGAYNAAMLALDPRWLGANRQAVRGFVGLAGPYDFLPFAVPASQEAFKGAPDPADTQPINHASAGAPPALLATAPHDTLVQPRNSDALAAALSAQGVPVERRSYGRVGHIGLITAFALPLRGRAGVLADTAAFARQVTGGAPVPR